MSADTVQKTGTGPRRSFAEAVVVADFDPARAEKAVAAVGGAAVFSRARR